MSRQEENRVLVRKGARELTMDEIDQVSAAMQSPHQRMHRSHALRYGYRFGRWRRLQRHRQRLEFHLMKTRPPDAVC